MLQLLWKKSHNQHHSSSLLLHNLPEDAANLHFFRILSEGLLGEGYSLIWPIQGGTAGHGMILACLS